MITITTAIIVVMVIIILVITIIPDWFRIDSESSLRLLQAIYNSKYINMSRIESFPLSYQVLFKYAQISSKNLIEISFKKSYCCVKNVKNAISNHNLKKAKEEQRT